MAKIMKQSRSFVKNQNRIFRKLSPPKGPVKKPWPSIRSRTWSPSEDGGGSNGDESQSEGSGEPNEEGEPEPAEDSEPCDESRDQGSEENEADPSELLEPDQNANEDDLGDEYQLEELLPPTFVLPGLFVSDHEKVIRVFNNWSEFVLCAADLSLRKWSEVACISHHIGAAHGTKKLNANYFGTASFEESVEMALYRGWPEGVRRMSELRAQIIPKQMPYKATNFDIAGMYPMIPIALAGDPASMVVFDAENTVARPIIKLGVDVCCPYWVQSESIMIHGINILSMCDDLEARGYSVQLDIIMLAEPNFLYSGPKKKLECRVSFKRAGMPLDPNRAAFALAHSSVLRRFMFAIEEQHEELERCFCIFDGSSVSYHGLVGHGTFADDIIMLPAPSDRTVEQSKLAILNAVSKALPSENFSNLERNRNGQ